MENQTDTNATVMSPADAPKSKKRKTTKCLKEHQRFERSASKSARRVARAVLSGLNDWNDRREKSASKKKDGAIRDALENAAHAMGKVIENGAKAGPDFIKGMKPRLDKKSEKRIAKAITGLF